MRSPDLGIGSKFGRSCRLLVAILGCRAAFAQLESENAPLNVLFPHLVKCDPASTFSCIKSCQRSIDSQPSDVQKTCAMIRCVTECTQRTVGECAAAGQRACRLLTSTMATHDLLCLVECD
mmetsp:Transcript_377/g.864  ORF Transcript_377/g.864 Transcript_377/m.864 type:complete len:121 (-) Transcript_377:95-457(-)